MRTLTNKQIAERLSLSHRTVGAHLYRISARAVAPAHCFLQGLKENPCPDEVLRHDAGEVTVGEGPEGDPGSCAEVLRVVLNAVTDTLTPDGAFTTFAYTFARWTRPARRLRRSLHDQFEEVVIGRTVWANLPPACVYFCRRPRVSARPHALLAAA